MYTVIGSLTVNVKTDRFTYCDCTQTGSPTGNVKTDRFTYSKCNRDRLIYSERTQSIQVYDD